MLWERETARFAGISDLAAETVIVQENRGEAGGWVAVPEKLWRNAVKMHSKPRGGLEVARQGGG